MIKNEYFLTLWCYRAFVTKYIKRSHAKMQKKISKNVLEIRMSKFCELKISHHIDKQKLPEKIKDPSFNSQPFLEAKEARRHLNLGKVEKLPIISYKRLGAIIIFVIGASEAPSQKIWLCNIIYELVILVQSQYNSIFNLNCFGHINLIFPLMKLKL